jgi:hypothetical protein
MFIRLQVIFKYFYSELGNILGKGHDEAEDISLGK